MARIKYGSIITDIQGSIGGVTYQKNGSGQIARLKPRRVKTNTAKQAEQHPRMKTIQNSWNQLTFANKQLWNDFAGVYPKIGLDGSEKILTGYQWFLSINQNRVLFNDDILEVPPVYEVVNPISGGYLTYIENILRFNYNEILGGIESRVSVYSSFVVNSLSRFDFNICRNIKKFKGLSYTGQNINGLASDANWQRYYNLLFPPELNNKSFYIAAYVKFIGVNSGISSLAYTDIAKFVWDGSKYVIE